MNNTTKNIHSKPETFKKDSQERESSANWISFTSPENTDQLRDALQKCRFTFLGGNRELHEKLELAIGIAKSMAPDRWTIVSRAQLDPAQFPDLLLRRFPGKTFFIIFTIESFLPDMPDMNFGPEDWFRQFSGCLQLCRENDIEILAIMNDVADDDFWGELASEQHGGENNRKEPNSVH